MICQFEIMLLIKYLRCAVFLCCQFSAELYFLIAELGMLLTSLQRVEGLTGSCSQNEHHLLLQGHGP